MKTPALLTLTSLCIFSHASAQAPGPLRVFASNGIKAVAEDLKPQTEKTTGRPISFTFDSTVGLRKRIAAGEPWDVAIFTSDAVDSLIKDGSLNASTRTDFATVGVGVGYKTGTKKPHVETADAMKKTLLDAKSVTYAAEGASRVVVERMIDKLGLAATLKPRIVLAQGSGPATAAVAAGKSDIVLTLASEILPVSGLSLAGGIPKEFQQNFIFSGAANVKTANLAAAKALLAALKSPAAAPIYKARGMEPR